MSQQSPHLNRLVQGNAPATTLVVYTHPIYFEVVTWITAAYFGDSRPSEINEGIIILSTFNTGYISKLNRVYRFAKHEPAR